MTKPIVLAIDTCSSVASLAITRGEELLATTEDYHQLPHSQTILANLESVLRQAQIGLSQVDILAGNAGPGSFTGVRVGLASLKGLGQALNRVVMGVNALDLTALSANIEGRFLVLLEAGRREVFAGLRLVESSGLVHSIGADLIGDLTGVIKRHQIELEKGTLLIGSGITKYSEELNALAKKMAGTVFSLPADLQLPQIKQFWMVHPVSQSLAPTLAVYVARLFALGLNPPLHAYYIRPSDAELHYPI